MKVHQTLREGPAHTDARDQLTRCTHKAEKETPACPAELTVQCPFTHPGRRALWGRGELAWACEAAISSGQLALKAASRQVSRSHLLVQSDSTGKVTCLPASTTLWGQAAGTGHANRHRPCCPMFAGGPLPTGGPAPHLGGPRAHAGCSLSAVLEALSCSHSQMEENGNC